MATLARLCRFAREHEDQARTNGDELRAEQWNDVIDELIDRRATRIWEQTPAEAVI